MKNADLKKLAEDKRLNSDAVRVVLFIESRGKGKHPISFSAFSEILNHAGRHKIREALKMAVAAGWVSRETGGYGKPDVYQFIPQARGAKTEPLQEDLGWGRNEPLGREVGGQIAPTLAPRGSISDPPARASKEERESSSSRGIRARGNPIAPRVEEELAGEMWDGFRNSLKDYFTDRVTPESQWAYLMTVRTWFQGSTSAPKGFFHLNTAQQRLLVASAVNELLEESPEEEKKNYRAARGRIGHSNTLRSKIDFLIRRHESGGKSQEVQQGELGISDPDAVYFPEAQGDG